MKKTFLFGAVCAALLIPALTSAALISSNYQGTGPSVQIIAPFATRSGVQSLNTYSGLLEVVVSGVGNSLGPATNDAFYGIDAGSFACATEAAPLDSSCSYGSSYQSVIGLQGTPFNAYVAKNLLEKEFDSGGFILPTDVISYINKMLMDMCALEYTEENRYAADSGSPFYSLCPHAAESPLHSFLTLRRIPVLP